MIFLYVGILVAALAAIWVGQRFGIAVAATASFGLALALLAAEAGRTVVGLLFPGALWLDLLVTAGVLFTAFELLVPLVSAVRRFQPRRTRRQVAIDRVGGAVISGPAVLAIAWSTDNWPAEMATVGPGEIRPPDPHVRGDPDVLRARNSVVLIGG